MKSGLIAHLLKFAKLKYARHFWYSAAFSTFFNPLAVMEKYMQHIFCVCVCVYQINTNTKFDILFEQWDCQKHEQSKYAYICFREFDTYIYSNVSFSKEWKKDLIIISHLTAQLWAYSSVFTYLMNKE